MIQFLRSSALHYRRMSARLLDSTSPATKNPQHELNFTLNRYITFERRELKLPERRTVTLPLRTLTHMLILIHRNAYTTCEKRNLIIKLFKGISPPQFSRHISGSTEQRYTLKLNVTRTRTTSCFTDRVETK